MKKLLLGALLLAGVASACHPNAPTTALATSAKQAVPTTATPVNPSDSTAMVLALVRQVDLAPAWDGSAEAAMEGFYGPDNYRMSFHFDSVCRDAQRPNVYHFQGRDRYKKTITPFTGTLTVTRLAALSDTFDIMPRQVEGAYTAYADFVLHESEAARGAGSCRGRALLDFVVVKEQAQQAGFGSIDAGHDNPTKSCGLVFKGTWQDNKTGQRQPVAWANYYGVIVPDALHKFGLGERMEEVNPALARYGWNTIMENDEWWADAPKPKLSL
jgi:hypothetical protein